MRDGETNHRPQYRQGRVKRRALDQIGGASEGGYNTIIIVPASDGCLVQVREWMFTSNRMFPVQARNLSRRNFLSWLPQEHVQNNGSVAPDLTDLETKPSMASTRPAARQTQPAVANLQPPFGIRVSQLPTRRERERTSPLSAMTAMKGMEGKPLSQPCAERRTDGNGFKARRNAAVRRRLQARRWVFPGVNTSRSGSSIIEFPPQDGFCGMRI